MATATRMCDPDNLSGMPGRDLLRGLDGDDTLTGVDVAFGGSGNDRLPGDGETGPAPPRPEPARFIFIADNGSNGTEPWVSDGTAEGTRLVKDIVPGPGNGINISAGDFASLGNGRAVFTAFDPAIGYEPWVSDGTAKGTRLVKDLVPGDPLAVPLPNTLRSAAAALCSAPWSLGMGRYLGSSTIPG